MGTLLKVDDLVLWDRLAATMNADPNRYELLGDIEMDLALILRRPDSDHCRILLSFQGIRCETVATITEGDENKADCWLEGDLADWEAMFADIETNGHATGEWTLNTLTIMGERIRLGAVDPMGWDKFHRFNQTLQEFVDAAGSLTTEEVS